MSTPQPGILAPVPAFSRYMEFNTLPDGQPEPVLRQIAAPEIDESIVVGFGPGLAQGLGHAVDGLRPFPSLSGPGCEVPSTQADLWLWLRETDRDQILHQGRAVSKVVRPAFRTDRVVDGFKYGDGRDLSGYLDGTETPKGEDTAVAAEGEHHRP